jgi:hypothetical protein
MEAAMRLEVTFGSVFLLFLLIAFSSLFAALSTAGQGSFAKSSVAQATGHSTGISCTGPSGTFSDTDLSVTFRSSGAPVIISFTAWANLSTNQGIQLRPTIDGQAVDDMTVGHFDAVGDSTSLSFSRAYAVAKGNHTYTVQSSCQGSPTIGSRWLTVREMN